MAYAAAEIVTAIAEVLEGEVGNGRRMARGVFARGVFAGQPIAAKQTLAAQTTEALHRFDVRIGGLRDNGATSLGSLGNSRIADLDVVIYVLSTLATEAQLEQRASALAALDSDLDDAIQALITPGNLLQTAAGAETGIVSELMRGPINDAPVKNSIREDWQNHILETEITGIVTLDIEMNG